ncbi:MAG: anthranilate phosphoribosyltransferase [Phycisphaerales bacterium]|nr:anthranilate phosphoribosyltransferase [Phycisphaerales bacterium]
MIQDAIRVVVSGRSLTASDAHDVAGEIMSGQASPGQIAGLLVALRMKSESVNEITGFARALRAHATPLNIDGDSLIDTCGTGGDGSGTFNISTAAAFVAAGAGCRVAKHGNRSVSGGCGSADVLEALGVDTAMPVEMTAAAIRDIGIGFLFAPMYHQAARHAAEPRRDIGIRSIFNIVGPLTNPAGAKRQLIGVFDERLTEPVATVLHRLGAVRGMVVHGEDGLDEITLCGRTTVAELVDDRVRSYRLDPASLGLCCADPAALRGGSPTVNAGIVQEVLRGQPGPGREIVVLNAAAAIYVAGVAPSIRDGLELARQSIDSGRAIAKLDALRAGTRSAMS